MRHSPEQAAVILAKLREILASHEPDDTKELYLRYHHMAMHVRVMTQILRRKLGDHVQAGPFKGMALTNDALAGVKAPILLGTYEHELHATIERIARRPFRHILNIGCAFGYYAVGLALRLPQARVHAFDIEPTMQAQCRELIERNHVADRVTVGGEFHGDAFADYVNEETLVVMDIEGAETALLDPERFPALRKMTIIVELHDINDPQISALMQRRFAATHDVTIIPNVMLLPMMDLGPAFDPLDQLLLTWENRGGPTPWGVMWPK